MFTKSHSPTVAKQTNPMKRIAGLAIPSFLGITMEVAHQLPGEHAALAAGMIAFLGHVLADLTAGRAEHVFAGLERAGNHDLEFAFAVAYRQALQILLDENHNPKRDCNSKKMFCLRKTCKRIAPPSRISRIGQTACRLRLATAVSSHSAPP